MLVELWMRKHMKSLKTSLHILGFSSSNDCLQKQERQEETARIADAFVTWILDALNTCLFGEMDCPATS